MKPASLAILSFFLLSCAGNADKQTNTEASQDSQYTAEQNNDFNNDTTTNTWIPIVSTDGNFRIKFPFKPIENSEIQLIVGKKIRVNSFDLDIRKSSFKDNNLGYMIAYSDAGKLLAGKTFDEFADEQSEVVIEASDAKISWENELEMKVGEGRERLFIFNGIEKLQLRQRLIHYKDRVYILGVITDYEHLFNYEISNFFRSFETLN